MGPSALSAGIFESGMYPLVLCRPRKSPLSRIWTHLVRLAGNGCPSLFAHLTHSDAQGGNRRRVLCRPPKSPLSRIWAHLPRLALSPFYIRPFQGRKQGASASADSEVAYAVAGDQPSGWWWVSSRRLRFTFQKTAGRFSSLTTNDKRRTHSGPPGVRPLRTGVHSLLYKEVFPWITIFLPILILPAAG